MALLYIGEDPWLIEHESCEQLYRNIMEQLTERQRYSRTNDKYSQISAAVRLRLKQYNNEVEQLKKKLDIVSQSSSLTPEECERRARQIEVLRSKSTQMQKIFEGQVVQKALEDRAQLIGTSSVWGGDTINTATSYSSQYTTADQLRENQKKMLGEQEKGLENLAEIISRQKNIAGTISNEIDYHNEILDDLGNQIDRTDFRVRNETTHISTIDRKDKTCAYWVVIVCLFISIIAVAVV